jgi:hypothetical protein
MKTAGIGNHNINFQENRHCCFLGKLAKKALNNVATSTPQLMRDGNESMNGLTSYCLKTVVMHLMADMSHSWEECNSSILFLKVRHKQCD